MRKIMLVVGLLTIPSVSALSLGQSISNVFRQVFTTLNAPYVQIGLTLLLFFMMLYAIFHAALKRVRIFQGENGLSRQGKIFGVGLALIATIGIFFAGPASIYEMVRRIFEITQVYGMIAFGIVIFLLTYYGLYPGEGQ